MAAIAVTVSVAQHSTCCILSRDPGGILSWGGGGEEGDAPKCGTDQSNSYIGVGQEGNGHVWELGTYDRGRAHFSTPALGGLGARYP